MMRRNRGLPLALLALLLLSACRAAGGPAPESRDLSARADLYLDAPAGLSIADMASPAVSSRFSPAAGRLIWVGRESPVAWLRFDLPPVVEGADNDLLLVLEPSFALILDEAELYLPQVDGSYIAYRAGARSPSRPGETPSRYFQFRLPEDAPRDLPCYLRVASPMNVQMGLELLPALEAQRADELYLAFYSFMYGILAAMILYNLFLFFSLRDRIYLAYILYVASGLLWQFWVQGHAMFLFGRPSGSTLEPIWVFSGLMALCGTAFSYLFLDVRRSLPRLRWAFGAVALLGAAAVCAGSLGLNGSAFYLSHGAGLTVPLLIMATAALSLRKGEAKARYFLIAWAILASSTLVFSLMGLRVLPVTAITTNCVIIGMTVEAILLSLALADRIKRLELDKRRLEERGARYLELSLTDELTGLGNKRALMERLGEERERAALEGRPLSLILLDLDDFKAVNDGYGHAFGDTVLKALAAAVRGSVRGADLPCRFGGEEFVIIMPQARRAEALAVAERVRERFAGSPIEREGGCPVRVTLSLGVTELVASDSAESIIDRADKAMYEAKRLGKNRTVAL